MTLEDLDRLDALRVKATNIDVDIVDRIEAGLEFTKALSPDVVGELVRLARIGTASVTKAQAIVKLTPRLRGILSEVAEAGHSAFHRASAADSSDTEVEESVRDAEESALLRETVGLLFGDEGGEVRDGE